MRENLYKKPVTAPLSTTCNGCGFRLAESNLIESNKDETFTAKFFKRRARMMLGCDGCDVDMAAITTSSIDLWSP